MSMFRRYRGFRDREEGNASIEFVLLFPAFIFLFLVGFEAGYYMVRNVVLERATDIAIRDVRLSNGQVPGWAALKKRICDEAGIIPDCMRTLQIEMQPVPKTPGGVATAAGGATRCIDTGAPPNTNQQGAYTGGGENQLMLVRVCSMAKPLFPTTGIGVGMARGANGEYAIVSTTAFVNEPGNRTMQPTSTGGGGAGGGGAGGGAGGGTGGGAGSGNPGGN